MKKLYVTPEIEVVKFNVLTDVLYVSTTQPEGEIPTISGGSIDDQDPVHSDPNH